MSTAATEQSRRAADAEGSRPAVEDGRQWKPAERALVAQVVGSFGGGGAQRLAYNLAAAIASRERRSICIALRDAGGYAGHASGDVQMIECGVRGSGWRAALKSVRRARAAIAGSGADIVHVHGSGCLPVCVLAMVGMPRRPRVVFTWHDSGSVLGGGGLRRAVMRWALRRCELLFGSSRDVARRLGEACGDSVDVRVFQNGVPVRPPCAALDGQARRSRIVWTGRLVPDKDPEILIRALARLRDEGLDFEAVIAGGARSAAYEAHVRRTLADAALGDRVEMPGWVDDVESLLAGASIGVQTSHTEGLSMALLEQMMAGLAVVATDVGDTDRAVEHGVSGLLVPPKDERALVAALRDVLTDAKLRRRLGAAARERAVREFSLGAMAERAMAAYAEVLRDA